MYNWPTYLVLSGKTGTDTISASDKNILILTIKQFHHDYHGRLKCFKLKMSKIRACLRQQTKSCYLSCHLPSRRCLPFTCNHRVYPYN